MFYLDVNTFPYLFLIQKTSISTVTVSIDSTISALMNRVTAFTARSLRIRQLRKQNLLPPCPLAAGLS